MTGAPPPPPPPPPGGSGPPGYTPPPPGAGPPPPPGYGSTPAPPPGVAPGRNGLAVASLVLGILSIPLCFLFVPSVLAVVFGAIALNQIGKQPGQGGRGQAIAGLVLGGVSLLFIVLAMILTRGGAFDVQIDGFFLR